MNCVCSYACDRYSAYLHYLPSLLYAGGMSNRADNNQSELDARLCLPPAQLRWAG